MPNWRIGERLVIQKSCIHNNTAQGLQEGWFFVSAITARKIHNYIKLREHMPFEHMAGKSGIGFFRCNYQQKKIKYE